MTNPAGNQTGGKPDTRDNGGDGGGRGGDSGGGRGAAGTRVLRPSGNADGKPNAFVSGGGGRGGAGNANNAHDWNDGLPLGPGVAVAARHPCGLLALDKPAGIATHPNRPGGAPNTLLAAPYDLDAECYRLGGARRLHLLNRLDSPTSGLVLATEDPALAATIRALFREHHAAIVKTYHAIVKGAPLAPPVGCWRDRLAREHRDGCLRAARSPNGVPALSDYEFLATARHPVLGALAHLRLRPLTGRTHQLRIQCALRARPILGDKTYGDFPLNRRAEKADPALARLFLHAAALELRFRHAGREHHFLALSPLPPPFPRLFPNP